MMVFRFFFACFATLVVVESAWTQSFIPTSGNSSSTAFVGDTEIPYNQNFHQVDDMGELSSSANAAYNGDTAEALGEIITTGFLQGVRSEVGADNSSNAGPAFGDERVTWSEGIQTGTWDTSAETSVNFVFTINVSVSADSLSNAPGWSANNFLEGEAKGGPYKLTWSLDGTSVVWHLFDNGYEIDSGSKPLVELEGAWFTTESVAVIDNNPRANTFLRARTRAMQDEYAGGAIHTRSGDAQTGVVIQ